jgi:translation initiation factor IF-1
LLVARSIGRIPRLSSPRFSLSKDVIELIGVIEECYPNTTFRVRITSLEAKNHELLCHLAGRMRVNKVRILPGDRVKVEMTPYDLKKGRIVYRFRADDTRLTADGQLVPTPAPGTTPPAQAA